MKMRIVFSLLLGLTLFAGLLAIQAQAQTSNKRTTITFNQPVQIPGKVLPAGTYTFTIPDTTGMRHIVQVWDKDKTNPHSPRRNKRHGNSRLQLRRRETTSAHSRLSDPAKLWGT